MFFDTVIEPVYLMVKKLVDESALMNKITLVTTNANRPKQTLPRANDHSD